MGRRFVLYFARLVLPEARARSIQITATAREMARAGARVRLFVRRARGTRAAESRRLLGQDEVPGLEVVPLRWHRRDRLPLLLQLLRARPRAPVVFIRQIEPYAVTLVRAGQSLGLPVVYEAHSVKHLLEREKPNASEASVREWIEMERQVVENASGIVATTSHSDRMLRSLFDVRCPTVVVPNGGPAPLEIPRGPAGAPPRDIDLLYTGQLYGWKGTDLLFAILARVPGANLHIVGGNRAEDLEAARRAAEAAGVASRVVFHGQVPPSEIPGFLARARCALIPLPGSGSIEARYFTSPLKLFEFHAAGVPVVASDLPSIREALDGADSARLAAPDDPESFAVEARRILGDPALAARLAEAGRASASRRSWSVRAGRILEFLDSVAPLS